MFQLRLSNLTLKQNKRILNISIKTEAYYTCTTDNVDRFSRMAEQALEDPEEPKG